MKNKDGRYSTEHAGPEYDGYVVMVRAEPQYKTDVVFCRRPEFRHLPEIWMKVWGKPRFFAVYVRVRKEPQRLDNPLGNQPFVTIEDDPITEALRVYNASVPPIVDRVVKLPSPDGQKFGRWFEYETATRKTWPQGAEIPELAS